MKTTLCFNPAQLALVAQRLSEYAGLAPESLEDTRMQWLIERRCRHLHQDAAAYLERLHSSDEELAELFDALVIQETRFFRDPAVFEHIAAWAPRMTAQFGGPLRILSAPCSTGQEAYSLAATLLQAGLPPASFTIDAFDLSDRALTAAGRGIYPETALAQTPPPLQALCGELRNHHWHIHAALRARVRFAQRNLAHPGALAGEGYHLILCRNLFIYLHAAARATLGQSLAEALLPGGRLIVGSADHVPELDALFQPLRPAASFAFTRKLDNPRPVPAVETAVRLQAPRVPRRTAVAPRPAQVPAPPNAVEFYRRALEHHRQGNLRQAERRCRQALYLAPAYLPALELLQKLWRLHPNMRLRTALKARIRRAAAEAGVVLASPLWAEGEGA